MYQYVIGCAADCVRLSRGPYWSPDWCVLLTRSARATGPDRVGLRVSTEGRSEGSSGASLCDSGKQATRLGSVGTEDYSSIDGQCCHEDENTQGTMSKWQDRTS